MEFCSDQPAAPEHGACGKGHLSGDVWPPAILFSPEPSNFQTCPDGCVILHVFLHGKHLEQSTFQGGRTLVVTSVMVPYTSANTHATETLL